MQIIKDGDRFYASFSFSYELKDKVKAAGMRFDADRKAWYTTDLTIAEAVEQIEVAAEKLVHDNPFTVEQAKAIQKGLQIIAGVCDGATSWDNQGFGKFDADFGKKLARADRMTPKMLAAGLKLVNKYRRQLPGDILATAKGEAFLGLPC